MAARKKSVAQACRDAVADFGETLWGYRDTAGEVWDAQPACFITDYLLAVQCFAFAVYVALVATNEENNVAWYVTYFVALGISAAFGGLLHHVAFEALRGIAKKREQHLVDTARVFGFNFKRTSVDTFIETLWRIVLGFSVLANFALLSLAASRYMSEAWAYSVIVVAGTLYVALAVWASINMGVVFLLAGYLPAMVFGAVTSVMAFEWQWSRPSNELLVYVVKLGSGIVQGLVVSPSNHNFNHNALSHVMLSVAATFMLRSVARYISFIRCGHGTARRPCPDMLLFGNNLSGAAKKPHDSSKSAASVTATATTSGAVRGPAALADPDAATAAAAATFSPRSDALHRLTNHELRLLEELERTRSKLQAEWRVKIAELQQEGRLDGTTVPSIEQLTRSLLLPQSPDKGSDDQPRPGAPKGSVPQQQQQQQQHKSIVPQKKRQRDGVDGSRLRNTMDMLPILTTNGETPFEVGLNSSPGQQQQQQHMLPVFRLPVVNVQATAQALVVKQVEVLEEDRERKQASEALGLSVDEIEMLESELSGTNSKTQALSPWSPAPSSSYVRTNQLSPGRGFDDRLPLLPHRSGAKDQRGKRGTKHSTQVKYGDTRGIGKHVTVRRGSAQLERSASLRKDLQAALHSVQSLTKQVKEDIYMAQRICPASELRTSLFFKRWGREKVENIFRRLLYNMQGLAFIRWRQTVEHDKQQEKLQAYLMYKGTKKLDVFFLNWSQRKLRQAWMKWVSDIIQQHAIERAARELEASLVMQRAWRGYRARLFVYLIKQQQLFVRQTAAALKIQRHYRGSLVRKFFRLKQLNVKRQQAATVIQAVARGYLARKVTRVAKVERRRYLAASRIQALYRGRHDRKTITHIRQQKRMVTAAVTIQRRYRGRLGRAKYIRKQIERHRHQAAIKIQTMVRGKLARKVLARLQEEDRKLKAIQRAAAINIQKVYRGHRARLSTELKLMALREKNKMRAQAATKIQRLARSRQAKQLVARLREESLLNIIKMARLWVEYWSEDSNMWFYFNQDTGDALWAPPPTGYKKSDGMLVLQNGKIIPDPEGNDLGGLLSKPRIGQGRDGDKGDGDTANEQQDAGDEEDEDEDHLCIECEEEEARRKCDQCEDWFCDACFEKLHRSAKREKHTWKVIGSVRCIECEKMKATRLCYVCHDPYCLGCFTIIHSKGNKSTHDWTDMATFKKRSKQAAAAASNAATAGGQRVVREEESSQTYDEFMRTSEYQYVSQLAVEEPLPAYSGYDYNAAAVESEWTTLYDEGSGQYYYYNTNTGESRWA
ncbi:TPA: hypothetical protein N0F65_008266 [Lagenidium giganteum]|uniref:WW domain-containing protein n=1 Tax=Lagenidium giganteum TaxID=4803 RepID=A0AAV2YS57_9STRA|nr:TPA: hypothetical protein N0F65_008266 [Lagenidium giganteum]